MKKEKKEMNFDNFVQSDNVIYKLIHTVKKSDENILFAFTVEVSLDTDKVTFDNNKDVQMKKSTKNDDTVKSIKNNDTVLSTKIDDTVKSINYDDFMNMTFKSFTQTTTD